MSLDPETIPISGGHIEVHPAEFTRIYRQPDGTTARSDPFHIEANVRVFLRSEDGFFAFNLSPAQALALAASVDRHCPAADVTVTRKL